MAKPVDTAAPRVLMLTRYGRMGASSRMRSLQYAPWLQAAGIDLTISPLFSDAYLEALYGGRSRSRHAAAGYLERVSQLLRASRYDLLWVEKELFPFLPAWFERLLSDRGVRYVVDYDDALFHRYDCHRSGLVRRLLGRKIDAVMRHARLVVAGNPYLAQRARAAGADHVEIVPTVVDLRRYSGARRRRDGRPLTVGWIGSPSTAAYLRLIEEALAAVQRRHDVALRLIGAGDIELQGVEAERVAWSEEEEVAQIASLDVGIMPLPDAPWERGKCGYKLIQYMACGLPVVASPVGVNRDIVRQGENGFLAETADEWAEALSALARDQGLRQRMGEQGRRQVAERYTLDVQAPRLRELLITAAEA